MKTLVTVSAIAWMAASIATTSAAPKDDLTQAIGKLAQAPSYAWKQTSESAQFNMGPTTGKIAKDGTAVVSRTFRENEMVSVYSGEKAATQTQDGWQSLADLEADTEGRGRFTAMMLRNFQAPTKEAEALLKNAADLSLKDGAYTAKLTEEGAKEMMAFRRGARGGGQGPEISGASGSVTFWVKDGVLAKYQYQVKGTMSFNGNDREMDRTTTVEISDVGTAKVEIPAEAKSKL